MVWTTKLIVHPQQKLSDHKTYKKLKSHRLNTTAAMMVTIQMLKINKNKNYRFGIFFNNIDT